MDVSSSAVAADDGVMHFMLRYNVATLPELKETNRRLKSLISGYKNHTATKQQFLDHIRNEIRLLDECKRVIKERQDEPDHRQTDFVVDRNNARIVNDFSRNIFNMYEKTLKLFPVCSVLLKEFIDFSVNNKEFTMECKKHLIDITSTFQSDPDVYITVAEFMYQTYFDINEARRYFTEGLNYYKDYKSIHIKQFAMEIQHLDVTRGATFKYALFNYQCLKHVYSGQIDFYFIILDKILMMSHITKILEVVIGDMILEFKGNKFMWQKLAQINEKGYIFDTTSQLIFYSYCDYCSIQNCISTYNLGLTNLPYNEWIDLWKMYLDHLGKFKTSYHMKNVRIANLINETMLDALETAHNQNALKSVQYYIYWAYMLKNINILLLAQKLICNQLKLGFSILLHYQGSFIFGEFLNVACIICIPSLQNKTFSLWKLMDTYMTAHNLCLLETIFNHTSYIDDIEMEEIVNNCFKKFKKIFSLLISGTAMMSELVVICPRTNIMLLSCLFKFHKALGRIKKTMIRIFSRKICSAFGTRNIGLWLDYIRFEYTYGSWLYIRKIFNASLKYLGRDLHDSMRENFNKLRDEFENVIITIDD